MATPVGTWAVIISTPIGKQHVTLHIADREGKLGGTATQGSETVALVDAKWDGARLTWSLSITKPLKLNIAFDVRVSRDSLIGTAKAGLFPASKLEGVRQADAPRSLPGTTAVKLNA